MLVRELDGSLANGLNWGSCVSIPFGILVTAGPFKCPKQVAFHVIVNLVHVHIIHFINLMILIHSINSISIINSFLLLMFLIFLILLM